MNAELLRSGRGVNGDTMVRHTVWDEVEVSPADLKRAACERVTFMNVQDHMSADNRTAYVQEIGRYNEAMHTMFEKAFEQDTEWERRSVCEADIVPRTLARLNYTYSDPVEAMLDNKTMAFLCARDGVEIKDSAVQRYRRPKQAATTAFDDTAAHKQHGGKSWLPEYRRREHALSSADRQSRLDIATQATARLMGAVNLLESLGLRPFVRSGLLIGTVRHQGWIDFGGTSYGSGYDVSLFPRPCCTYIMLQYVNVRYVCTLPPRTFFVWPKL
jgi:hypothetical protein